MEPIHTEHQHKSRSDFEVTGVHDKHAGHTISNFWKRFIVCSIFTIPVLGLSPMVQLWLIFTFNFPGDKSLLAVLSTFIFIYGGYPFLKRLLDDVKANAIGMMTLIGVAISVAWIYSMAITFGLAGMDFYLEMVGHGLQYHCDSFGSRSFIQMEHNANSGNWRSFDEFKHHSCCN